MTLRLVASGSGAAVLAALASGCGSAGPKASAMHYSARFVERTTSHVAGDTIRTRTVGAFDWKSKQGWIVFTSAGVPSATLRIVQVGDVCHERCGLTRWRRSRPVDSNGLCEPDLLANPASQAGLLRKVANSWTKVGIASVNGVSTTHYKGAIHIGTAVSGPFESSSTGAASFGARSSEAASAAVR